MHDKFLKKLNNIFTFFHLFSSRRPNLAKILINIGWLFFDKILRMGVGLLVGLWIARYLGPDKFGQISFAKSLVALFSAIAALGLRSIVVRDIVRNPESTDETLGTAFLMQFISGFISYWLILIAIDYLRPGDTVMQTIVAVLGSIKFLPEKC